MSYRRHRADKKRRRGVVAVQVLVLLVVLLGCAALSVDVGLMYNAKADLQRAADAAALAAAEALADYGDLDPIELARSRAQEIVEENPVLSKSITLESSDVVVGRAVYDANSNTYTFQPGNFLPDAVRITVRMESGSVNGALPLYFASVFGKHSTGLTASATAMMVPRDIAVVADLSGSHTDDSELPNPDNNLFEVWDALSVLAGRHGVDGVSPPPVRDPFSAPVMPGTGPVGPGGGGADPGVDDVGGQVGPTWGWLYYWGNEINDSYDPATDPGLAYLPKGSSWNGNANLKNWLAAQGYSSSEINALVSSSYDSSKDSWGQYGWTVRTAVALGLARWDSGKSGGLWNSIPADQRKYGDGNNQPESSELTWLVDYPFESGSWNDWIYNYVRSNSTAMYQADSAYRYRFGLKTFMNYLLERQPAHDQTSDLADTPTQPMQAVKDSVQHMTELLTTLGTNDQVSLEIYGTTARHEVDLTTDVEQVSNRLNEMQAGHYDSYTNMGGGIERAIEELNSARARSNARKVILLLTDGNANINQWGNYSTSGGEAYAKYAAQQAVAQGIRIYAVSVGLGADVDTMAEIAGYSGTEPFHASGSISEYSAQLDQIFQELGGARPVALIE
ncbi:MAG: VWA domain-containing protein [Phycisphaerae bacterium]|nr:VWA domain-containing protein [Phycisphaerae bacterium]